MKKILAILSVLAGLASSAQAVSLEGFLNEVRANSSLHFADNVSPSTFYDFHSKTTYAGVMSTVYSYRFIDAQVGGLKRLSSGDAFTSAAGISFHTEKLIGKALAWIPELVGNDKVATLQKLRGGPFYSYDFKVKVALYGFYASYVFGADSK